SPQMTRMFGRCPSGISPSSPTDLPRPTMPRRARWGITRRGGIPPGDAGALGRLAVAELAEGLVGVAGDGLGDQVLAVLGHQVADLLDVLLVELAEAGEGGARG